MPAEYDEKADLDEIFDGQMGWEGVIRYEAPYALYVEYDTAYAGTKPPFEPIHEWVQRNWSEIHPAILEMTENEDESLPVTEHQKRVAWFIVEQIAESGIEGVHFGKRALDHGKSKADSIVGRYAGSDDEDAPRKIAEELTELMFEYSQDIIEDEATDTEELKNSGEWEIIKSGEDE
jgi:hypothetical protein